MSTQRLSVRFIAGFLALLVNSGTVFAALDPQQFVVGWRLELPSDEAFYDIPLTKEVYQYGRSLNQLAVLDRDGKPMSFYRVATPAPAVSEARTSLSVSPIYARYEDRSGPDLSITTKDDRTDVVVTRPDRERPDSDIVAFVVDARDVTGTATAIELEWSPLDRPFLMAVSIQRSDDLTNWRPVGGGSIASLVIEGASVTHGRIAISGRQGGYYRLQWNGTVSDWRLERVVLVTSAITEVATFGKVDIPPTMSPSEDAQDNALYFDVGGKLPTMSVDLVFPDVNRWANANIYFGTSIDGPWRRLSNWRLFYDIDFENERLASEPQSLDRVEARFWKIQFDSQSQTAGLKLRLEYPEEHLRFAANGDAPYQLVGGTLSDEAGPDPTFAAVMSTSGPDQANVTRLSLGTMYILGGPEALETQAEFPWRSLFLWLVLIVAVLVIGYMAVRLARDMFAGKDSGQDLED
jgi:hypothetical protein